MFGKIVSFLFTRLDRPWGHMYVLFAVKHLWLKIIIVKPGGRLSWQLHKLRNELWICCAGGGISIRETADRSLNRHDHLRICSFVYIPTRWLHRLCGDNDRGVSVVEIAWGPDVSEDDIVRYEDSYGRETKI